MLQFRSTLRDAIHRGTVPCDAKGSLCRQKAAAMSAEMSLALFAELDTHN